MNLGVWSMLFEFVGATTIGISVVCLLIRWSNMDKIKAKKVHKNKLQSRKKNAFVNVNKIA